MADTDKRELILARLPVIAAALAGIKRASRNDVDVPESDRPAVVVLDADESTEDESQDGRGRGRPAGVPVVVAMTPEIYILTGGKPEDVGPALNRLRSQLIKAILLDETLLSLVKDRDITYLGFATGMAAGRSLEGEAGISFRFRYLINPATV